jgi:hypothetical protein
MAMKSCRWKTELLCYSMLRCCPVQSSPREMAEYDQVPTGFLPAGKGNLSSQLSSIMLALLRDATFAILLRSSEYCPVY